MSSITIRNIPDEVFELVKTLAQTEKRSMNSEMVLLLEKGILNFQNTETNFEKKNLSKETQVSIWREMSGKWKDKRATNEIIDDIYSNRTSGREVHL
jgi:plasmid stability protein